MLKHRLLTAIILIPIIFLVIYEVPVATYAVILALVMALAAWEWSGFSYHTWRWRRLAYIMLVLLLISGVLYLPAIVSLTAGLLMNLWFLIAIVSYQLKRNALGLQYSMVRLLAGLLTLVPCWVGFMTLRHYPGLGPGWVIVILLISWAVDTGGYIAGRLWGKRPLATYVSPRKTTIGFFGGVVLGILVTVVAGYYITNSTHEYVNFIVIGLFAVLFAIVGDLSVSLLKRQTGKKDTSRIIPGHGGILDRLDSVAATVIIFALGAVLLRW